MPAGELDPLTKRPDAKTAIAKSPIVSKRRRRGVRNEPTRLPSQTRIPLAVETLAAAVIMHCMHMDSKGYAQRLLTAG